MILHIALYKFQPDTNSFQIEQCVHELKRSTSETGLATNYLGGQHILLPADKAVPHIVYDYGAIWMFPDMETIETFSRHPIMVQCVSLYVQPIMQRLAIINFDSSSSTLETFFEAPGNRHVPK